MRNLFLGILFVAVLAVVVVALPGCGLNQTFVMGVDAGWSVIGPEYTGYVQADPKLTPDDKTTRLRTAQLMTELIEEAKKP